MPQFSFQASYCLLSVAWAPGGLTSRHIGGAPVTDAKCQVRESGSDIHDSLLGGELDRSLDLMTASVMSIDSLSATHVRHLASTGGGDWAKVKVPFRPESSVSRK